MACEERDYKINRRFDLCMQELRNKAGIQRWEVDPAFHIPRYIKLKPHFIYEQPYNSFGELEFDSKDEAKGYI